MPRSSGREALAFTGRGVVTYGSDTTALVFGQMQRFFSLTGDHRALYAELVPAGFEACLDYYKANLDLSHGYSDRVDDIPDFETSSPAAFTP